jgi:hypothetical protein
MAPSISLAFGTSESRSIQYAIACRNIQSYAISNNHNFDQKKSKSGSGIANTAFAFSFFLFFLRGTVLTDQSIR